MFGVDVIRNWVQLLTARVPLDKQNLILPEKIIRLTLTRAKLCESIANQIDSDRKKAFYLAGIFSSLNEFFAGPMEDIMKELALTEDIYAALIVQENSIKEVLALVEAVEKAKWEEIHEICQKLNIRERCLFKMYAESINWTAKIQQSEQDSLLEKSPLLWS
ncbi:hypothetical protein [Bacillus benzoevorans]|uniref:C-di-GMP-related signal transduction protein n=1 Tax=Bacillus benzoevorans TaxID=1456 RepID=A0A7X0HVM2_9BACI|nr:hypothetical protein [Bacillus benzoevorans]MBB6446421.1 c-di-GMP-related signal transduction protein [Bacillus benzoevorans]